MNRTTLTQELKAVGVTLSGWMPVLRCEVCGYRWEPFQAAAGGSAPTARLDYWRCINGCNKDVDVSRDVQTAIPRYLSINNIAGMIFDDDDLIAFERYARSMDLTEIP